MSIPWYRVLLGGLFIEVVLVILLVGGFAAAGVDLAIRDCQVSGRAGQDRSTIDMKSSVA